MEIWTWEQVLAYPRRTVFLDGEGDPWILTEGMPLPGLPDQSGLRVLRGLWGPLGTTVASFHNLVKHGPMRVIHDPREG